MDVDRTENVLANERSPDVGALNTTPAASMTTTPETTDHAAKVSAPEKMVVNARPPDPDYPRWRVEPGENVKLADIDPDESEKYKRKKDVRDELEVQRDRIRDLQARLYAERKQSLLI